jgi:Signal transduction histidine kinase
MVVWLIYKMLFGRKAYFLAVFVVIGLNFVGVLATSLQYLGYDPALIDFTDDFFIYFGIANTFFLPPFVIAAFFMEMLLVFYFSVQRFIRLIEKNKQAEIRLARAKADSLNALVVGAENERKRLARELHDGACVNLAAINMKLDTLSDKAAAAPELSKALKELAQDLESTYRELRGVSHDLMSKGLEKMGLEAALEELVLRARQAQPSLEVHLFVNYPFEEVNALGKLHLYRIAQELVGNALKHAQAKHLNIQFLQSGTGLMVSVEDDGQGFDPQQTSGEGIGMSNIRARANVLRAKVNVETAPGKGTFVSLEVPGENLVG